MKEPLPFKPFYGLKNPHLQTLLAYIIKPFKEPESTIDLVDLLDGDKLALEITTPSKWKDSDPTVLLAHGIGGSSKSPYIIRLAYKLNQLNIRSVRINFRGIGPGLGLARKISNGGSSKDLYAAIQYIKQNHPHSPLIAVGFSLSGNILLKLAGESLCTNEVQKIIAICPAINLKDSSDRLAKWHNHIYQRSILNSIFEIIDSPKSKFAFQPKKSVRTSKTLKEFDTLFTAPASGFSSAEEYYQKSSSIDLIKNIKLPCHLLFSEDDPLVDCSAIKLISLPKNVELKITKHGGHMGFLNYDSDPFWMDKQILYWIQKN